MPGEAGELRGLGGVDQLAALVEEVAHGHRQVLLALGDRDVGQVAERRRGEEVLPVLGDAVVAHVPDDRLVVAEHAEVVRDALGVRVPQVGAVAGRADRVQVRLAVLQAAAGRVRVRRVDAVAILVGDHEHLRAHALDGVGERGRLDVVVAPAVPLLAAEPDLDLVTGLGALDLAAELGVVVVVLVAVALAALPFGHGRRSWSCRR